MAKKHDLHHWDNSRLKNWIIVGLCVLKNKVFLVYDEKKAVATFQTRKLGNSYLFQKLATSPDCTGAGIGSFCLEQIESYAAASGCDTVVCEVYDKSLHALKFYEKRGYSVCGTSHTVKYTQIELEKRIKQ